MVVVRTYIIADENSMNIVLDQFFLYVFFMWSKKIRQVQYEKI